MGYPVTVFVYVFMSTFSFWKKLQVLLFGFFIINLSVKFKLTKKHFLLPAFDKKTIITVSFFDGNVIARNRDL